MNVIGDFQDRLRDVRAVATGMDDALNEIARAWECGQRPVSGLTMAKALVAVDDAAARLERAAEGFAGAVTPMPMTGRLKDK